MKVLRLIGGLDPGFGGPSVSSINSTIAARREGVDTTIAFPTDPNQPDATRTAFERLDRENISHQTYPLSTTLASTSRRWGISPGLAGWIRREATSFDIIHCHSAWVMPSLVTMMSCRNSRKAMSPHEGLTDFDLTQGAGKLTSWLKRRLRPRFLSSFDMMVMSSVLEARDSIAEPPPADLMVEAIHHPVFDETLRAPRKRVESTGPGLRIGFFGRLHPKKNLNLLIQALPILPETVTLVVGGNGPERDTLRALAEKIGVAERIEWLGFVEVEQKPAFFHSIDLLAMPSDYECFGMAAAEALVEGCPAIVTAETGISEIIKTHQCGEIVDADPTAIARSIESFLSNRALLGQYSARATETAASSLSFAAHGKALAQAYERLLAKK